MWPKEFSTQVLIFLSTLLGVSSTPQPDHQFGWQVTQPWTATDSRDSVKAQSKELPEFCRSKPNAFVEFPSIIHGAHIIRLDGRVIKTFGDPTFKHVESFYGAPFVRCEDVKEGSILEWEAWSYTRYFSRFSYWPRLTEKRPTHNLFAESASVIASGGLLLMAIFAIVIFYGKVPNVLSISVSLSNLFISLFFAGTVSGVFELPFPMLTAHKFSDFSLWLGVGFLLRSLWSQNLIHRFLYYGNTVVVVLGALFILLGKNGDDVQLGTTLPFGLTLISLTIALVTLAVRHSKTGFYRRALLELASLASFVVLGFNDVFVVTGVVASAPLLPLGIMGGLLFLSFAVNDSIIQTYEERDYLRKNLELEVEKKTSELKSQTIALQTTMTRLKTTQAELIQSAKLASLGTLSAGIAHEINNSLNYVNGALFPLEKMITKTETGPQAKKLFGVMKEGLNLTFEIIQSLKNYTGLNQAKFNDVSIESVFQSVSTILKNRMRENVKVEISVSRDLKVFGNTVGLNQIFMNLISNSLDAMPEGGTLRLEAISANEFARIKVSDTGVGIVPENIDRVFDPFFTTKTVGDGTGLGLYIVKTEVEKHHGRMDVQSKVGEGTTFTLYLPINNDVAEEQAA